MSKISQSQSSSTTVTPDGLKDATTNLKYLRKHEFIDRPSLLDDSDPRSQLKNNSFLGFYNLIWVVAFYYFITTPILRYKEKGQFIDTQLFDIIKQDFLACIIIWPSFYIWSHIAYLLQLLILLNFPTLFVILIQHFSQSLMFVFSQYMVLTRNWCMSHGAFVTFNSCIFFMKMHSYTVTNQKLRQEWIQLGKPKDYPYPHNISIKNFTLFLWYPTLVYEPSYPRRQIIRKGYLIQKMINAISMLLLAYQIVSEHIIPMIQNRYEMSLVQSISAIICPMIAFVIITFNMIFENYLNVFAEITYFADREFYQEWWNSTGYEEFNRKWNKPVYEFLYRHVYLESIFSFNCSIQRAQMITFLFSAILHEYTLAVSLQQFSPIMMGFMMIQIPVMVMTKKYKLKGTVQGNLFWWWGIFLGIPLILNLYLRFDEFMEKGVEII